MPEPLMKAYSKKLVFVPQSTYHAIDMLETAMEFLACICGGSTMAAAGYKAGRDLIKEHRSLFDMEAGEDKLFYTKYICFLDRYFQRFCTLIQRFAKVSDPVRAFFAAYGDDWMETEIRRVVEPWSDSGILPRFRLPLALEGKKVVNGVMELSGPRSGGSHGGGGGPSVGSGNNKRKRGDEGGSPLADSEYVPEWQLPPGKKMADYFGGRNSERNLAGIPKVKHHRSDKMAHICLRYQLNDGVPCRQGAKCHLAHVRPSDLSKEDFESMSLHMKKVYGGDSKA